MSQQVPTIQEGAEAVKQELRGSLHFVVGVLTFGAVTFAILFNLCYLAVQNDLRVQRAYLVLSHHERMSTSEIEEALLTLDFLLREDARRGGRPILCEQDEELIALYPKLQGRPQKLLGELLTRKTGVAVDWDRAYIEQLPTSRSPFSMPFLELNLLYYGWVIEIATIIFLSQSLRKPHVQEALYKATLKPGYFLPIVTVLLYVPAWHWALLVWPHCGSGTAALVSLGALLVALLCFKVTTVHLTAARMNEMGFHLLISSLFIQLLTAMGDNDVVYMVFSADKMVLVRYATWFIILCYPGLLLEKWYRSKSGASA